VVRRCVPESEVHSIMIFCDSYACGGHLGDHRIAANVLQRGYYWTTKFHTAHHFYLSCEHCQCTGALSHCDIMPISLILIIEIFDVGSLDFMGPFPKYFSFVHILVAIDYVSK